MRFPLLSPGLIPRLTGIWKVGTAEFPNKEVGNFMSAVIIAVIVVAVIVVGIIAFGVVAVLRRRRLKERFGPEYDRVVGDRDSRREGKPS